MPSNISYRPNSFPGPVAGWPRSEVELKPAIKTKPIFGKRPVRIAEVATFNCTPSKAQRIRDAIRQLMRNESGVAAVEFGVIVAALAPVFIYGGEQIESPLLAWATQLHADAQAAADLCNKLGCQ